MTEQDVVKIVAETLSQAKKTNGNGVPKDWREFCWRMLKDFGFPTAACAILLVVFCQSAPRWVDANIKTQQSLTDNLKEQTANIKLQTDSLQGQAAAMTMISGSVDKLVSCEEEKLQFRERVAVEHAAMVDTMQGISKKLNGS